MNSKSSHKNTRSTCNAITTSGKCGMPEPDYNTDSKRARLEEHKKEHEVLSEDNHEPPVVAPSSQNGTPHESSLLPLPSTPPPPLDFHSPPFRNARCNQGAADGQDTQRRSSAPRAPTTRKWRPDGRSKWRLTKPIVLATRKGSRCGNCACVTSHRRQRR